MSSETSATRDAAAPFCPGFDENAPSDAIIQSSDGVRFYVHWAILGYVSHFFRNMQAFPPPSGADANTIYDGKPVIPLPEPHKVIEKLLLALYPHGSAAFAPINLNGVDGALEAARKYDIPIATFQLKAILLERDFLQANPHRIFAIACHHGYEDVAQAAAIASLDKKGEPFSTVWPPPAEYRLMSGLHHWKLHNFRQQCAGRLAKELRHTADAWDTTVIPNSGSMSAPASFGGVWWDRGAGHAAECGPMKVFDEDEEDDSDDSDSDEEMEAGMYFPAKWFRDHIRRCRVKCETTPSVDEVTKMVGHISAETLAALAPCAVCSKAAPFELISFARALKGVLTQAVEQEASKMKFTA
ncbi:hypothetical protein MIND_00907800 [Mycena indigotica]|uniref:BTB domain-containing protein n=1 Tax=Mycena indigotica TaxID=2126181 RepID=A0A8H6SDK4_9AGAR|nr:uncharacterized protein MIND_00907800 [Mycena indigotica]KAF7296771.1 hypothetical protein MIND_00907800 [Mycena indigotica]